MKIIYYKIINTIEKKKTTFQEISHILGYFVPNSWILSLDKLFSLIWHKISNYIFDKFSSKKIFDLSF